MLVHNHIFLRICDRAVRVHTCDTAVRAQEIKTVRMGPAELSAWQRPMLRRQYSRQGCVRGGERVPREWVVARECGTNGYGALC